VSAVRGRDVDTSRSEFISPDIQLEAGQAASRIHGWEFDADSSLAYMDLNVSGSRRSWKKRRGLMQHLADARAGKFNVLIFYKLSRLARNVREGLEIWEAFEAAGCAIYICKESIDSTTPVGRMIRSILLAVAEMQAEDIAEWAGEMHDRRAGAGKPPPMVPAWLEATETGLVINEERAAPIRRLVELRLAGKGYTAIARILNGEGHRMMNGKPYTTHQVLSLLTGDSVGRLAGESTYHTASRGITKSEGVYPALITPAEVNALRGLSALLRPGYKGEEHPSPSSAGRGKSLTTPYLLSSLLICSICGAPLKAAYGGGSNERAYRCARAREDATRHPDGKGLLLVAEPVELAVLSLLQTLLRLSPPLPKAKPRKPVKRQRTAMEVQREMSELVRMKLSGRIRPAVYDENYDRLEAELAAMDRESLSEQAEQYAVTQATQALTTGDLRAICLHLVRRAEAPVYLPGVEYIGGNDGEKRYGNGTPRRCVRVTTILRFGDDTEWIVPIYRAGYGGTREIYRADGTLLTV
jgi:DNA invertase Pin-like site-specific DNA recombinase